MEQYGEKVREILEKLMDENPEHSLSLLEGVMEVLNPKPFFSSQSLLRKLTDKMKVKLVDCGWKDEIRLECNKIIQQKGLENITDLDTLVKELTPMARARVPMEIKKDIVAMLKNSLMKELDGTDYKP